MTNSFDHNKKFNFLEGKIANEPHIYEVLEQIDISQQQSLPNGTDSLATKESLQNSRNIKIPFTTSRTKSIEYIIDLLLKNYAQFIKSLHSFDFIIGESTQQISIIEKTEYTIMLNKNDLKRLATLRDDRSQENLLNLVKRYRIFNISQLLKKAKNKSNLSKIIKLALGSKIFTFKHYSMDKNKIEWAEDYCFYIENYDDVKDSLSLDKLNLIISNYAESVNRGLKKFGILNADFSDYRDTKLDYIFSILIEDLATTIHEKDMMEVKNIQSLRDCLQKVDKVIDPLQCLSSDIISFIRKHKICTDYDIINSIMELSDDLLKKWITPDNLQTNKILTHEQEDSTLYLVDGSKIYDMISNYHILMLHQPDKFENMTHFEKEKVKSQMKILCQLTTDLLSSEEKPQDVLLIEKEKVDALKDILKEYENHLNDTTLKKNLKETSSIAPIKKKSFINRILEKLLKFISFFTGNKTNEIINQPSPRKKELSDETKRVYNKAISRNALIMPLSDFIDLTPENDHIINKIISELRYHNIKIVIPIYDARTILYPRKSQKILIPDTDYLLISNEIIKSPEEIRKFTDSLVGKKLKDEIIPAKAIITIEKYLLILYRQKKALRKKLS